MQYIYKTMNTIDLIKTFFLNLLPFTPSFPKECSFAAASGKGYGGRMASDRQVVQKYAYKNHIRLCPIGIVADGKLVFSGSVGYSELGKKTPATALSDFGIASMTKKFRVGAILNCG